MNCSILRHTDRSLILDGVPLSTIAVSSLTDPMSPTVSLFSHPSVSFLDLLQNASTVNQTALEVFNREQNRFANIREYLMQFTMNLTIGTVNSIQLQSSSLVQLTQATNQLTRTSAVGHWSLQFFEIIPKLDHGVGPMCPIGSFVVIDG